VARLGWLPSRIGGYAAPSEAELEAFGLAQLSREGAAIGRI
jgi:hypothetical protein